MTSVVSLGQQAAEAIRELNHRTRSADAFADPAELCELLADLAAAAQRLPQLFGQLASWIANELAHGRLEADDDIRTDALTSTAFAALADATRDAGRLAAAVDTAHQRAAHLAKADRIDRATPSAYLVGRNPPVESDHRSRRDGLTR